VLAMLVGWSKLRVDRWTAASGVSTRRRLFREVLVFAGNDSFTQTLAEGESGAKLKPLVIIRATRRSPDD